MCAFYAVKIEDADMKTILDEIEKKYANAPVKTGIVAKNNLLPVQVLSDGGIASRPMWWGLPRGSKDVLFNARVETVQKSGQHEKSICRGAHPVVIPVSSFFEWSKLDGTNKTYAFQEEGENITYIAGLFKYYEDEPDKWKQLRYTMLTTEPNKSFDKYHHRMPVVIHKDERLAWLKGENQREVFKRAPFELSVIQQDL